MAEDRNPAAQDARPGAAFPFADRINEVGTADPWLWLANGWRDFCANFVLSIGWGIVFAGLGIVVTVGLYLLELTYLIWPMAAGFILIAPIFCTGFYGLSRKMERGEAPAWTDLVATWRRNPRSVLGAGLALVFFMLIWIRTAALIYAINFPYSSLSVREIAIDTFFTYEGLAFITVGTTIGAILAFFAFLVSVVSLQNMVDRREDFLPAILISVFCVFRNFVPMMMWAAIIVLFTVAGLATAYLGLAITLPLIGHASWHAYRATVRPAPPTEGLEGEGI